MKHAISPTRQENYPQWYQSVVQEAELAENGSVRGTMVMKPWGYGLWERIQQYLDSEIKKKGHQNIYCPMFIPLSQIEKEADHIDGFAKECAVVTHSKLVQDESGKLIPAGQLEEPLVVRPTSEMIIGDLFSKWVQSYRDLPILINQWANIVRWEMRTRMFLRTSEFLWQEGHTAHQNQEEALHHAHSMLETYITMCHDILAIPVIAGEKSLNERFPGALNTLTIEAMMQDGKALQLGTSHFLGQTFSKASDIQFQDQNGAVQHAWTTSWGVTTRLIGGLIMTHSDDDGLMVPPKIAYYHVVICPILMKNSDHSSILDYCQKLADHISLQHYDNQPIRVFIDSREKSGGEKNWHWVKKGVPVRLEVGMREVTANTVFLKKRCVGNKGESFKNKELGPTICTILEETQDVLYQRAQNRLHDAMMWCPDEESVWSHFKNDQAGFALTYWHQDDSFEKKLKEELSVTIRCFPRESLMNKDLHGPCFFHNEKKGQLAILARAY